ncbi:antibiotic biosynthesis monooxygenase family protein [Pseudovibrio exalbescens]|uniref:antibiotic biosynthesis monooxygenase family protein n=1 Tax=Pseudovibrio exalbescens TaxID=197461 RepID=UPI000C9AED43|nr:antibiotic biosynthesis monooxygenase [Pseudovibrio exalbescens]
MEPAPGQLDRYFDIAAELRPFLHGIDGFISIERFQSVTQEGRILSLSFWRNEAAIAQWRQLEQHRLAQSEGRSGVFRNYRLRVAEVTRDYGLSERSQAPADSVQHHRVEGSAK